MHTQFEVDMMARAVHALEAIADELRMLRELKTQEVAEKLKTRTESNGIISSTT